MGFLVGGQGAPRFAYINPLYIWNEKKPISLSPIASLPLPSSPLLVPLWLPSLPSLAPHCHCHPARGGGHSSWSGVGWGPGNLPWGPGSAFSPCCAVVCPTDPQVLRGGGAAGGWPGRAPARSGDLGGWPCAGAGPWHLPPAISVTGSLPGGVKPPPHTVGPLQQRRLSASDPKISCPTLRVRTCASV